jgi:hypothetical protein
MSPKMRFRDKSAATRLRPAAMRTNWSSGDHLCRQKRDFATKVNATKVTSSKNAATDSLCGGYEKRGHEHRGSNKHLNAPDGVQRVRQKLSAVRSRGAGLDQRAETDEQAGDLAGEDEVDAAAEQHHQTYDPQLHVHAFTK